MSLSRRQFARCMAALGGLASVRQLAAQQGGVILPQRQHLLFKGGSILSMDASIGDLPIGDLEIRDGQVAAIGPSLEAPGAEVIDATDKIILPGFVETHWHVWTALLRSLSFDGGYFAVSRGLGSFYLERDMYIAGRFALAEAIDSGITHVHDWCHNVRAPGFAEQALTALGDSGIRARFSYGTPTGLANEEPIDRAHLAELAGNWRAFSHGGRVGLGLAWRGVATAAALGDRAVADELDLPVSVHVNNFQNSAGGIAAIARAGLLGPRVQLIHGIWSSPAEIAAVADSGASLSLSPYTEMRIGFGLPPTGEFLAAGVPVGLSVDTTTLSGNADMFAIMKAILNVQNARTLDEFSIDARRVLELATIEGARSLGIDAVTGSLTPGKRADVIVVDTRRSNLGVITDPVHLIVEAAQPANVEAVLVDGRFLKRAGRLTAVDLNAVIDDARAALAGIRARSA
jgi:cytosine/adenosine deaminase-related metal-dependent hydrolase